MNYNPEVSPGRSINFRVANRREFNSGRSPFNPNLSAPLGQPELRTPILEEVSPFTPEQEARSLFGRIVEGVRGVWDTIKHQKDKAIIVGTALSALLGPACVTPGVIDGGTSDAPPPATSVSPEPTVSGTEPTPPELTPGYNKLENGNIVYLTEEGERLRVPKIPGLRAVLRPEKGKVIYKALEGNPYGLEANHYAGEYKPDVSIYDGHKVEEKLTGGVALDSRVVFELQKDRLVVVPSIDPRHSPNVRLKFVNGYSSLGLQVPLMIVDFEGTAPLVNTFAEANTLHVSYDSVYGPAILETIDHRSSTVPQGAEKHYLVVIGRRIGLKPGDEMANVKYGQTLSQARAEIIVSIQAITNWIPITPDRVLQVQNTPVFPIQSS